MSGSSQELLYCWFYGGDQIKAVVELQHTGLSFLQAKMDKIRERRMLGSEFM